MKQKKENSTKIIERLSQFIDFKEENFTQLALKIGVSNSYFSKMVRNGGSIGTEIISKIVKYYDNLSADWLLTGRGEMLLNQNVHILSNAHAAAPLKNAQRTENHGKNTKNLIPLYSDVSSIGGNNELSANMDGASQPVEYIDTGDWFRGATAALRHYGDSMMEYPPGCILALKEVKERHLIVWGEDYVIETNEYRITKRLQRSENKNHIKACSSNIETYPDGTLVHEPIDIALSDINKIFLVLGHVIKKNGGTMVYSVKK